MERGEKNKAKYLFNSYGCTKNTPWSQVMNNPSLHGYSPEIEIIYILNKNKLQLQSSAPPGAEDKNGLDIPKLGGTLPKGSSRNCFCK